MLKTTQAAPVGCPSRRWHAIASAGSLWLRRQRERLVLLYRAVRPSEEEARDIIWALTGRDLYRMLVLERGWSSNDYEKWLGNMLAQILLKQCDN